MDRLESKPMSHYQDNWDIGTEIQPLVLGAHDTIIKTIGTRGNSTLWRCNEIFPHEQTTKIYCMKCASRS